MTSHYVKVVIDYSCTHSCGKEKTTVAGSASRIFVSHGNPGTYLLLRPNRQVLTAPLSLGSL